MREIFVNIELGWRIGYWGETAFSMPSLKKSMCMLQVDCKTTWRRLILVLITDLTYCCYWQNTNKNTLFPYPGSKIIDRQKKGKVDEVKMSNNEYSSMSLEYESLKSLPDPRPQDKGTSPTQWKDEQANPAYVISSSQEEKCRAESVIYSLFYFVLFPKWNELGKSLPALRCREARGSISENPL